MALTFETFQFIEDMNLFNLFRLSNPTLVEFLSDMKQNVFICWEWDICDYISLLFLELLYGHDTIYQCSGNNSLYCVQEFYFPDFFHFPYVNKRVIIGLPC